ncbi:MULTISPECIES: hypothetical protein [Micromonospora]|uniref:hypothetical protein n=1 Tax=Micromonospora TaxID=1873 RepID=UPI000D14796C|nr:hypothetical protein [Micromonospora sp. MH33]PSK62950.1 hypothetical protein B0E53_05127 [Micromonospora sp. MH33]
MTLRDALLIIAHRDRLADLDGALALVGVRLEDQVAPPVARALTAADPADLLDDDIDHHVVGMVADGWSDDEVGSAERTFAEEPGATSPAGGHGAGRPGPAGPRAAGRARGGKPPGMIAAVVDAQVVPVDDQRAAPLPQTPYRPVPRSAAAGRRTDPAFAVRTLSSTLHSLVRVWRHGTEPDMDAVVDAIATMEPLTRVPMTRRLGQPDRICVLSDLQLRSGPYRDDVRYLLRTVRRLFSDGRLEFMTFRGSPARGCGTGPVWTWKPYEAHPKFDVTMVVGVGVATREGDPDDIHRFAMSLMSAGQQVCTVLIGAAPLTPSARPYPQLLVRD